MSSHDEKHRHYPQTKGLRVGQKIYRDYARRRIAQRSGMRPMRFVPMDFCWVELCNCRNSAFLLRDSSRSNVRRIK